MGQIGGLYECCPRDSDVTNLCFTVELRDHICINLLKIYFINLELYVRNGSSGRICTRGVCMPTYKVGAVATEPRWNKNIQSAFLKISSLIIKIAVCTLKIWSDQRILQSHI